MGTEWKLGDRVKISCNRDTTNEDIRRLRDERAVGVITALPTPGFSAIYYVGFNGNDLHSMYSFLDTELVPESDEQRCEDLIPVMRWSMDGLPDLFVKDAKDLGTTLQETFLGEAGEWKDYVGNLTLICTVEMMPRVQFETLEPWEP